VNPDQEGGMAATTSTAFYRAANCEGLESLPFRLPLSNSVDLVINALEIYGTVLIKAPPGSGKTSFIVRILLFVFAFSLSFLNSMNERRLC